MRSILAKLALAMGAILFPVAMALALANGVPVITALYRSAMIMFLSTVCVLLFLQFFARILYQMVLQQVRLQQQARAKAEAAGNGTARENKGPNNPGAP